MALTNTNTWFDDNEKNYKFNFEQEQYAIGGKLVTVSLEIDDSSMHSFDSPRWREMIREQLATRLANYILQNKLCEITMAPGSHTFTKNVYMRCYLAPDSQVKILRVQKIK